MHGKRMGSGRRGRGIAGPPPCLPGCSRHMQQLWVHAPLQRDHDGPAGRRVRRAVIEDLPDRPPSRINYTREVSLTFPREEPVMVRPGDWSRIRRSVERLGEPLIDRAHTWSATAFGGALGLGGTLGALFAFDDEPKPEIVAGAVVLIFACVVFSICFGLVGRAEEHRYRISSRTICEDMDGVATEAGRPELVPRMAEPKKERPLLRLFKKRSRGEVSHG